MELIKNKGWRSAGVVAIALLFASGIAFGQAQTGNIFAKVTDDQGAALPGVNVTLTGMTAPISQVTNVNGEVRFLNLSPGKFTLDFSLQGFGKVKRTNITVAVGQNTDINVTMKLAGVQESVVVTGESPLLDTKKTGSQSTVSSVELAMVPTARDPFVVLQTAPGVMIDRLNIGGSESGQQAGIVGKGSGQFQGTWNIDGINITDMSSSGTPTYYDFDEFAELNMATGGADASIQTPGIQLNMVTKRGTNDIHGSARIYLESGKSSSTNTPQALVDQGNLGGAGNSIDNFRDYGAEVGFPVVKDHVWLWGAWGRNDIELIVPGGNTDKTYLTTYSFKLNAQPIPENSFSASYLNGEKLKYGRYSDAYHPTNIAENQAGPTKIYKIEDSHIFSSDVFATVNYARTISEFTLISAGRGYGYIDANGVYSGTWFDYGTHRPQTQVAATPSFFFRTGSVGHEIKAGFVYRTTPVTSTSSIPNGIFGISGDYYGTPFDLAKVSRPWGYNSTSTYYNGYIQDTMTMQKLTIQLGLRYDWQSGNNLPTSIPCCNYDATLFPESPLRAMEIPGTAPLVWKDFSPRVGLTYAIGNENKTLVRASYARFVNQLLGQTATYNSAAGTVGAYLYYEWHDANGNHRVDPGEINWNNLYSYTNWDPSNPNSASHASKQINYSMKTPHTDEFILGFEHELMPAFVVGLTGTYRKNSDLLYNARLSADGSRPLTPADYNCSLVGPYPVPGGSPEMVNYCVPKSGVYGPGYIETNRPGAYQTYWGIDFSATKRYADNWMARFNFTYNDWTQHGLGEGTVDPSNLQSGTEQDGGIVANQTTGSGHGWVFINSRWQTSLSGMYTFPLDFNLSTTVYAREGYPVAYFVSLPRSGYSGASLYYQLGNVADQRLNTVFNWDLGVSKVLKVSPLAITLQLDCFNILNRNTVLGRQAHIYDAAGTTTASNPKDNLIIENQSPRVFRAGVRIAF